MSDPFKRLRELLPLITPGKWRQDPEEPKYVRIAYQTVCSVNLRPEDAEFIAEARAAMPALLQHTISDEIFEEGVWKTCSGCHESNEGHPTGPYSEVFRCHLGGGCRECGGIGAVWEEIPPLVCCARQAWGDGDHDLDCPERSK